MVNKQPPEISEDKNKNLSEEQKIINSIQRDNYQREQLSLGISDLNLNDWIIISDLDEIPNLQNIDFSKLNDEILIFKQKNVLLQIKFTLSKFYMVWIKSC